MINEIAIAVSSAIIIGCMATIAKHIINLDKHPQRQDIVFKDVCETKHQGLTNCIEGKITALDDKFETFREDIKSDFTEVKELIRNKL